MALDGMRRSKSTTVAMTDWALRRGCECHAGCDRRVPSAAAVDKVVVHSILYKCMVHSCDSKLSYLTVFHQYVITAMSKRARQRALCSQCCNIVLKCDARFSISGTVSYGPHSSIEYTVHCRHHFVLYSLNSFNICRCPCGQVSLGETHNVSLVNFHLPYYKHCD